jgi:3-(3-hydroxy-phenyl)propionate hydroxylase
MIAVVGAGPVGLTLAGRLAQRGVPVTLFEAEPGHTGEGSRALCMQRETLEIWARLGIGEQVARRGVQWRTGRTYFRDRELFSVTLPAEGPDHFPPFVNISQTEVEQQLLERLRELGVEIRWGHRLTDLTHDGEGVVLRFVTPDGEASVKAAYAIGTDGAHSGVRHALGLPFEGHTFDDLFLIADVRAQLPFPAERRFFFDPPFNPGRQVLIHPQPDDVWRIDWQVPPQTDATVELRSGGLDRRVRAVIGQGIDYELVWLTAYRFSQRLADRFRVGRVLLAGDAAHVMSPFGARGLNSGVADAENLAWRLALVLAGSAPEALLDSYDVERRAAAVENLAVTDATMRFMVPHGRLDRWRRNAILRGSPRFAALRRLVNSGRLAEPPVYASSPLTTAGPDDPQLPRPGSVAPDAPLPTPGTERLRDLLGDTFVALLIGIEPPAAGTLDWAVPVRVLSVSDSALRARYAPNAPRAWLIRPDGHLAGSAARVEELPGMLRRAIGTVPA